MSEIRKLQRTGVLLSRILPLVQLSSKIHILGDFQSKISKSSENLIGLAQVEYQSPYQISILSGTDSCITDMTAQPCVPVDGCKETKCGELNSTPKTAHSIVPTCPSHTPEAFLSLHGSSLPHTTALPLSSGR